MAGMKNKFFFMLIMVALLGACGKKPGFVDAPAGQEGPFPRQYPAPEAAPVVQADE